MMASGDRKIYPFKYAEVKEDKPDRCTITFFLDGLTQKHKVEASIVERRLTVQTEVNGKFHEARPVFTGDVQQGKLEPKVKDGRVHVTFKKMYNFSISAVPTQNPVN